jgi:arylsulfatase A-like enzyme
MDTVRADHLSAYGYDRTTAPNLARLAERGVKFENATAASSWTLPSHSSLFTARWPHQLATLKGFPLERGVPTLAEYLGDHGYATAGFAANQFFCSYEHGLSRGFAHYEDYGISPASALSTSSLGWLLMRAAANVRYEVVRALGGDASPYIPLKFRRKVAPQVNRDGLRWLDAHTDRPFFVFLNYFDAHDPYLLPAAEPAPRHFGLWPTNRAEAVMLRDWHDLDKRAITAREIALARDSYDDCIAYLDRQLGQLFGALERRGLLKSTILIVTSDHGEHFGEHGLFGHGVSLYQQEVRVPLLIIDPRSVPAGKSVSTPVSLRDVPATIADLTGLGTAHPFPGASLARYWQQASESGPAGGLVLSEVQEAGIPMIHQVRPPTAAGPLASITGPDGVYIRNGDGREEFYEAASDPQELNDRSKAPDVQPAMRRFREILDRLFPSGRLADMSRRDSAVVAAPPDSPRTAIATP